MLSLLRFGFVSVATLIFIQPCSGEETIVAKGAELKKLAGEFQFTEGPAWNRNETLYFSDIPNQTIHTWSEEEGLGSFKVLEGSSNGLRFDKEGNLIVCQPVGRAVLRISPKGEITTLADTYNGKKLNSPNDLWIDPQGGIYFSDPRYGSMDGLEQDGFHVYYLHPNGKKLDRVLDDLQKPNGVIGSADGKRLYIADHGADKTYVYKIDGPGKLTNRQLAADSGSDGLSLDSEGNLYLTANSVRIFSPPTAAGEVKEIASIPVPEKPANLTFGGDDGKTLFITARKGLYSIELNVTDGSDPFSK